MKTKTTKIKYKKPEDRKINHSPDGHEVVNLLINKLEKKLEELKEEKNVGIRFWTDERFAKYATTTMLYRDQLSWLKELREDIDLADIEHEMAIEGTGGF